jgi:hypothetical protein
VQVSSPEWAPTESTWKYRITVQQQQSQSRAVVVEETSNQNNLFLHGNTLRSLADFAWLESSLRQEFQGALLLPLLSISLQIPNLDNCQHQVDCKLLAYWLSDTLNGIRGHGEIVLLDSNKKVNIMETESMEAFLYRTELVPYNGEGGQDNGYSHLEHRSASLSLAARNKQEEEDAGIWSFLPSVDILCGGSYKPSSSATAIDLPHSPQKHLAFRRNHVSSKALGDSGTFQLQNSFVESSTFDAVDSHQQQQHPSRFITLIQAERELTWVWRTRALKVQKHLALLVEQERTIGNAWKRFAVSISNLFAYEKEVESARISGDTSSGRSSKQKMISPYRKLHKSTVDESLRVLANSKMERSIPSLEFLETMLNAYIADLSAVPPSIEAYLENLHTVRMISHEQMQRRQQLFPKLSASTLEEKKSTESTYQETEIQRFMNNEEILQQFLTTLCQTAPLRTSRMAHAFFIAEERQCQVLISSAENLKQKINIASKESLSKLIHRHLKEEKEDKGTELALVQRMVHIGNANKFPASLEREQRGIVEEVEKGVELSKEDQNEQAQKASQRDKALFLCRERIGRWDSNLAMAILEATGVSDANLRVEETTRDLRLVRKYAIGLREHLQKCVEAVELLQQASSGDKNLRHQFITDLQTVFSTSFMPFQSSQAANSNTTTQSVVTLQSNGIRVNDPSGWLQQSLGSCGGAVATYLAARESGTDWLLNSLSELLKEYNQRVEAIESFVYMECVGIQLEKHYSQSRATALKDFEKKTEINSAINIATRKRMPVLVKDLKAKLETVEVSHTTVKEAKEAHLESKTLKQELNVLALRRLTRGRETSTERVIALLTIWSKEEEGSSMNEVNALKNLISSLERGVEEEDLQAFVEVSPSPR